MQAQSEPGRKLLGLTYSRTVDYAIELVESTGASVVLNFGDVCNNLGSFGWNQSACPYPEVIGVGGDNWTAEKSTTIVLKNVNDMPVASSVLIYHDSAGIIGLRVILNYGSDSSENKKITMVRSRMLVTVCSAPDVCLPWWFERMI